MTDEDSFRAGYVYGCEWSITAHDELLEPAILLSSWLRRSGYEDVADSLDEHVSEVMRRLRRLRGDQGQAEALDLYRLGS